MESIIHADIFFFISTIALCIISAVLIVILMFVVVIMADVKHITGKIRKESDEVIEDLRHLRNHIKTEGLSLRYLGGFLGRLWRKNKVKRKD